MAPAPLHLMCLTFLLFVECCQPALVMWSANFCGNVNCNVNTLICVPDILQACLHATLAVMSAIGVSQAQKEEQRDLLSQVKQKAQQDLDEAKRKAQKGVEERMQDSLKEGGNKHDEVQ